MPAIVKANATLMNGSFSLVDYTINVDEDGAVSIDAEFVALTAYTRNSPLLQVFTIGYGMPDVLRYARDVAAVLIANDVSRTPVVDSVEIIQAQGLTTIRATYAAPDEEEDSDSTSTTSTATASVSTSEEEKSLSGTVTSTLTVVSAFSGTSKTYTKSSSFAFSYIATTITSESTSSFNTYTTGSIFADYVGSMYNKRGIDPTPYVEAQVITTNGSYVDNIGTRTYTTTKTGVYVQTVYGED